MTRGESMRGIRKIRALVPVSVIDDELEATALGSQIAAHFVDLPVGEPSPLVRLHQVSYSFQAHKETGRGIPASRLAGMSGFAPATFHALGARVAGAERRKGYQLCVTNVPGPQAPLYAAGARMVATYPVPPLFEGRPLAIGVTSYDGAVFYGINADRDMLPDADLLGQCVREALDELVDSAAAEPQPRTARAAQAQDPGDAMTTRVYLPLTIALLAELHAAGEVDGDRRRRGRRGRQRGRGVRRADDRRRRLRRAARADPAAGSSSSPSSRRSPRPAGRSRSSGSSPCTPTPRTARSTPTPTRTSAGTASRRSRTCSERPIGLGARERE